MLDFHAHYNNVTQGDDSEDVYLQRVKEYILETNHMKLVKMGLCRGAPIGSFKLIDIILQSLVLLAMII
jgi:hypothetical protein